MQRKEDGIDAYSESFQKIEIDRFPNRQLFMWNTQP